MMIEDDGLIDGVTLSDSFFLKQPAVSASGYVIIDPEIVARIERIEVKVDQLLALLGEEEKNENTD